MTSRKLTEDEQISELAPKLAKALRSGDYNMLVVTGCAIEIILMATRGQGGDGEIGLLEHSIETLSDRLKEVKKLHGLH